MFLCIAHSAMQVLQRDEIMNKYQELTARLEQDLNSISIDELDISDEVKEQARFMLLTIIKGK